MKMIFTANDVAALIRTARTRRGQTQAQFAAFLRVSQSQLSRYERGKYNPPARVINICMREAHISNEAPAPSADDLAQQVRMTLASPDKEQARLAVANLLAAVTNGPART
ncbi:MAG: helix-turn-helix domain-containing protein [Azoarcus sp.]|jgi:transcriptional regulator with XRE-family HTH domain|nr:helix-turn-helix domain-containing protein [Azoarcus sp.]